MEGIQSLNELVGQHAMLKISFLLGNETAGRESQQKVLKFLEERYDFHMKIP